MQAPSKELLAQVKNGDKKAFGELYLSYRRPCYAFALLMLKKHEDAEDAVQNTFMRMYGSIRTLQNDEAFIVWMETILNRECLKIAQRRRMEITDDSIVNRDRLSDQEEEILLPEPYAERKDLSQRLQDEIEKLPFEQRRAMLLFYYHGLSLQEISDLTGCNISTVKSRLRYARKGLKENIERQEKKYGDKFFGIPLLPLGEILDRIFERQKGEKKPAALWKSLQMDIDAVYGGFNAKFSGSGLHTAKIVAGVLAAMMALGAAAGILSGSVTQESSRGWSNLQGGETEQDYDRIPSTEPGTRVDNPIQNPIQNVFAPAGADAFEQNALNTPQNDPNNQAPAVLPTQTVQNPPVLPTQPSDRGDAPTQPIQQPTQEVQDTEERNGDAYQAYRALLQQNAQSIRNYNWQYSDSSYPVVTADIYGDDTPELLYISADGNTANLDVYTYDGEKTVSLLSGSDGFSSLSDVDDAYFLYQKSGDKRLYLYIASDSDFGTFRNIRFDESAGGLRAVELAAGRLYPSHYTVGGSTVSQSAYAEYEKTLFSDICGVLLRNDIRGMCSDEAYDALGRYPSKAMSLNDMLSYLEDNQ